MLGGSSLLLAAGAHAAGGGVLPSPGVLVVAALLLGLVAVTVTARRCRFPALLVLLSAEQLLLHLLFTAASGAGAACSTRVSAGHHHQDLASGLSCSPTAGASGPMALPGGMAGMWIAHLAAILATAWLLSCGEAWLWRTAEQIVRAATAAPAQRLPMAEEARAAVEPPTVDPRTIPATAAPRGPPVLSR